MVFTKLQEPWEQQSAMKKNFYSKYRYLFNSKFLSQGHIGVYEG